MLKRLSVTACVRLLGAAAQVVLLFAITQLTGPHDAGVFLFGYSVVVILSTLSRLGTELSGMREVASHRRQGNGAQLKSAAAIRVKATLIVSIGSAVICCLASLAFGESLSGQTDARLALLVQAIAIPALAVLGLLSEMLKSLDRVTFAITIQNIAMPLGTVFLLATAGQFLTPDAVVSATAMTIAAWLAVGVAAFEWRRCTITFADESGSASLFVAEHAAMLRILRDAPALMIVSSTSIVMQWIGSVLLGFFARPEDVAGFGVAMRLAIAVSVINSAVLSVMAPKMAAAQSSGDTTGLESLAHLTSTMILSATAPILVTLALFSSCWLSFFGPHFTAYADVLRLLLIGQVFAAVVGHSGIVLVMTGRYSSAQWTSVIAALVLAGTMAALIPSWGADGAAIAMVASVIAGHGAGVFLVRRELGFWSMPTRLRHFARFRQDDHR